MGQAGRTSRIALPLVCLLSAAAGYGLVDVLSPGGSGTGAAHAGGTATGTYAPRPGLPSASVPGSEPSSVPATTYSSPLPAPTAWTFRTDAQWLAHTGSLFVGRDRRFVIEQRTYHDCSQDSPPCDDMGADPPELGVMVQGVLTRVSGDTAIGRITRTTAPTYYPLGRITLTMDPAHNAVRTDPNGTVFCGPDSPGGYCGV
jgi:hypothetical protein